MPLPLVSCIIPVYNGERYIGEAIESVRKQTYSNLEIVVVDDGSTDQTAAVVKKFGSGIKYFYQPNAGPGPARNFGIRASSGEWLAFLDADDLWLPDKIKLQAERLLSSPRMDLCFSLMRNFWDPKLSQREKKFKQEGLVKLCPPFSLCTLLAPRSSFEKIGKFDYRFFLGEEVDLFLRMSEYGLNYEVVERVLVRRRLHGANMTWNLGAIKKETLLRAAKKSLAKHRRKRVEAVSRQPEAERLFERGMTYFQNARELDPSLERYYSIAGQTIGVRFANKSLMASLTLALEHLMTRKEQPPKLVIYVWEGPFPELEALSTPQNREGSSLWGRPRETDEILAAYSRTTGNFTMLNKKAAVGLYHVESSKKFPQSESGAPFVKIFNWWFRDQGFQLIHAGALATSKGAILLAGKGGSGKSTAALSGLASDLFYLSDDYCMVKTFPPYVYSLFCSGKLNREDASKFPYLKGCVSSAGYPEDPKIIFFLNGVFSKKLIKHMPVRAIFLPVPAASKTSSVERTTSAAALRALAPSSLFQLPNPRREDFYDLVAFVKNLPCYVFRVGTDVSRIPEIISEFLHKKEGPGAGASLRA
jgi:glycosyltransferase involved in cell wall biosynthesis